MRSNRKIDIAVRRLAETGSLDGTPLYERLNEVGNDLSALFFLEGKARSMIEYCLNNPFCGLYQDDYPQEIDQLVEIILQVEYSENDQEKYKKWILDASRNR